ncbi:MAG: tetratricopeptide repeat protein [Spartobacteria bacterium]|nr:tetratricopeptide repeat protein [Spartobacteria bacterium]
MAEVSLNSVSRKIRDMYNKAFSAMERGSTDYAVDMYRAVLDMEPGLLIARKFLRAAEIKRNAAKPANHVLSTMSCAGKMMGVSSSIKKDPLKALGLAEDLLVKDPLNMKFIHLFEQAAVAAGLPEAAIQTLEMVQEQYPADVDLLVRLGKLYLSNDRPIEGRDALDMALKLKPSDASIQKMLKDASALATMKKGNWEKDSSFRDKLKDSEASERLEQSSRKIQYEKDLPSMIEDMEQKVEADPANLNYRRGLADLYAKNKQFEDAVNMLEASQEMAEMRDQQVDLSVSRLKLEWYDFVIEDLRRAGRDDDVEALIAEKNEFHLEDARDRVQRYPNDLTFMFELGELLYENGEYTEAIQLFQKAQRQPAVRIRSLYYMGACFRSKGQFDIAMEQLEKAAAEIQTMTEEKKDIYYELGCLAEETGAGERALEFYKSIYAVDISYKDISQKMEQSYKKPAHD